jgi:hypothetical protein
MISASSETSEDSDGIKHQWQKSEYKSFDRQCKDAIPKTIVKSKRLIAMFGGMNRLLNDLTDKEELSNIDK